MRSSVGGLSRFFIAQMVTKHATLPESMNVVVAAVGEDATIAFLREYGGTRQYIPVATGVTDAHKFVALLGKEKALRLSEAIGGTLLNVPACARDNNLRDVRRDEVLGRVYELRKTLTVSQIALQLGITERTVFRIMSGRDKITVEGDR